MARMQNELGTSDCRGDVESIPASVRDHKRSWRDVVVQAGKSKLTAESVS